MGSQLSLVISYPGLYLLLTGIEGLVFLDLASVFICFISLFHSDRRVFCFHCKSRKNLVCEGRSREGADYSEGERFGHRLTFSERNIKIIRKICGHKG